MRRSLSISCLSLFALFAVAQEGVRRTPGGAPLPPAAAPGQEAARGIEKKDIRRGMVVYPANVYSPEDVKLFAATVNGLLDNIAPGAKMTKADAAAPAVSGGPGNEMASRIQQRLAAGNGVAFLSFAAWPSSAGNKQVQCPPQNCGCKTSVLDCSCTFKQNLCICFMCYEKVEIQPYPEDSLSLPRPKFRTANPAQGGAREFLIAVVAPPDASQELRRKLLEDAIEALKTEPWPEGLVIKTKSTPRYYESHSASDK